MVLLFCWVGMVGIKSGNACGKDKDENAVVLPVYERNGRMYVEIEQTYLGREWMVLAQIDRGLGIRGKLLESKGIFRLEQGRDSMTLDVFAVFCPERVSDTTWMSNGLLKMSGLQTPVETWPVAEKKETGYLIDVTDGIKEKWYVGDGKWGRIQYGRSEIITVDTCRNGACFTIRHYLECSPEQQVVEMLPESGSVPVEVSVALCLLPDRGFRNRGEDPDGLFRTQVYVDYGVNPFRCVECTRCVCWDTYAGMPLNICVAEDIPEDAERKGLGTPATRAGTIEKLVQKALKNDKIKVKIEKLKNKKVSSVLTVSEESRRMQDMMKMYGGGMDMSMFGAEGETLVLNANHPLVTYITEHEDDANTEMICEQLYDLAKLQNAPLSPEAMTKFVARSNDIMLLLAKQ